jgi:hypothetical protein
LDFGLLARFALDAGDDVKVSGPWNFVDARHYKYDMQIYGLNSTHDNP